MTIGLHTLHTPKQKSRKRVGRGNASGHGTYSGRGIKGQRARTGGRRHLTQRAIKQFLQQIPKLRGFKSRRPRPEIVSIETLDRNYPANALVTPKDLAAKRLVSSPRVHVRVLGGGKLSKSLAVRAHGFSKSAEKAITAAGGSVQRIEE